MAIIKPFKAIRPAKDKVHLVVTRSSDSYSKEVMDVRLKTNPYSFLHVLIPDYLNEIKLSNHSKERSLAVRYQLDKFLTEETMVRDLENNFYVYRQKSKHGVVTGLIALASCEDYKNGTIKKHEKTLQFNEQMLKEHLSITHLNTEPVCFTYPDQADLDSIIYTVCLSEPVYDFSTVDTNRHTLWKVNDPQFIERIIKDFEQIPSYYIADGHHRSASASLLADSVEDKNHPYNYFMGVFFAESQMKIFEFNRLVSGLENCSFEEFLNEVGKHFEIKKLTGSENKKPIKQKQFTFYYQEQWYSIEFKNNENDSLDFEILNDLIFGPVFGIIDVSHDKRVQYIPGIEPAELLEKKVNEGEATIAFCIHPITHDQLRNVADKGLTLPPKSTWIEPKMRNGITVYDLK